MYNPSDYPDRKISKVSHFIGSAKSYPDDSIPKSCNMAVTFRHFEVKIEVVRVMHVEEVA